MRMAAFSMMRKDDERSMWMRTSERSLSRSRNLLMSSGDDVSRFEETMDSRSVAAEMMTSEFGKKMVSSSPDDDEYDRDGDANDGAEVKYWLSLWSKCAVGVGLALGADGCRFIVMWLPLGAAAMSMSSSPSPSSPSTSALAVA